MSTAVLLIAASVASAQSSSQSGDSLIDGWLQRSSRAQADQPHWMAPLFTVTPRLVQQFRYDISWQIKGSATTTNFGTGKGLELIPTQHTEIFISLPPYIVHDSPLVHDGVGDMTFLFKYRVAAANEQEGNFVVTAFLAATAPTGSYSNGAPHALFTPTFAVGKGWGNFDIQSTAGVVLPAGDVDILGTPVVFNNTFQYRILKKVWPEVEINSTFWGNGRNAGKTQVFVSPGVVVGRFRLWRRVGFVFGGGVQIAATEFHTYDRNWVTTVRFPF